MTENAITPTVVIKRNDTFPPLRGKATEEDGSVLIDLSSADALKVLLKCGSTLISGYAEVIDEEDPDDPEGLNFNWQYKWAAGDTAMGGLYESELEIIWDEGSSPPAIESVPNGTNPIVEIIADLG